MEYLLRMKTRYHLRDNRIVHGSKFRHTKNPTGILVDMVLRTLKYNKIKKQRNG